MCYKPVVRMQNIQVSLILVQGQSQFVREKAVFLKLLVEAIQQGVSVAQQVKGREEEGVHQLESISKEEQEKDRKKNKESERENQYNLQDSQDCEKEKTTSKLLVHIHG